MARQRIFTNTGNVQTLVELETKKAFKVLCAKNGTTPSEYLRELIERMVEQDKL